MRRRRPAGVGVVLVVVVLAGLVVGACGAPIDDRPRALEGVPADLLAASATTTTVTSPPGSTSTITIYFFGAERLVQVQRQIPTPPADRFVERVVSQVFAPPREDEVRRGLRSFVNPSTAVLSASVESGIVTIDLNGPPSVADGEPVAMALAQIVYTATSASGVIGVQFTTNGKKKTVPTSDGSLTSTPVGRASYAPRYGPL
jgi:spore germination protein GerM